MTNKLIVINHGRCGQSSGIVREKFAADVLQVRPKPEGDVYPALLRRESCE